MLVLPGCVQAYAQAQTVRAGVQLQRFRAASEHMSLVLCSDRCLAKSTTIVFREFTDQPYRWLCVRATSMTRCMPSGGLAKPLRSYAYACLVVMTTGENSCAQGDRQHIYSIVPPPAVFSPESTPPRVQQIEIRVIV